VKEFAIKCLQCACDTTKVVAVYAQFYEFVWIHSNTDIKVAFCDELLTTFIALNMFSQKAFATKHQTFIN
jgi:hypothetical protein